MACFHKFMGGFGGMGDALTCVKCGYSKYPEALPWEYRLLCRRVKNNGTYRSFSEYPFVRKYPKVVTFNTEFDDWTHFYNRKGKLVKR